MNGIEPDFCEFDYLSWDVGGTEVAFDREKACMYFGEMVRMPVDYDDLIKLAGVVKYLVEDEMWQGVDNSY